MAVVAEGNGRRVYLDPETSIEKIALQAKSAWRPSGDVPARLTGGTYYGYGLRRWSDLYSERQLTALDELSGLLDQIAVKVADDAANHWGSNTRKLAEQYGSTIRVYLAFAIDKIAESLTTICTWSSAPKNELVVSTFRRQALPMTWDWAECNPFAESSGSVEKIATAVARVVAELPGYGAGIAHQADAQTGEHTVPCAIVSTDPPYYDNISYADLSDFFYVWLRRNIGNLYPDLTGTMFVPKEQELVAAHYRHGSRDEAEKFFQKGIARALMVARANANAAFPVTLYYAFKQTEDDMEGRGASSTGWETFLDGVLSSGLAIMGTWPMRTERGGRSVGIGANALASSIILVCRVRADNARAVARRDFLRELERELPRALEEMTSDPSAAVAPVDLQQASIGPGMAVFSKYAAVLEADGSPMSVHNALIHINKAIDDYFAQAEGHMDADTRFCIGWFQQYGFQHGPFGEADVLARAKGTSVDGAKEAGVVDSGKGKVRLLNVKDYPKKWDPQKDDRKPVWEACHQMSRALGESESDAGKLLARMPELEDDIRQLAYRLYTLCERKGWAEEARAYNELVTSWPEIVKESQNAGIKGEQLSFA
jgi:putative DNA methylase